MGIFMVVMCFATVIITMAWKFTWVHWFQFSKHYYKWNYLNNKYKINRILIIVISLACLLLYFIYRWGSALEDTIRFDLLNQPASEFRSANLSGLFLFDICSLSAILLPVLAIFDKKRILLKPLTPLGMLGGMITLIWAAPEIYTQWSASQFFLSAPEFGKYADEPLTFIMHYWLIAFSIVSMVWDGNYKLKDILILLSFIACYVLYVALTCRALNVQSHCTALVLGDFYELPESYYTFTYGSTTIISTPHPTYAPFTKIFPLSHQWEAYIFAWGCFVWFTLSIMLIRNIFGWIKKQEVIVLM